MAIEPVELESKGVDDGFRAELHFSNLGFANRSVIPRAEDEPLLSAGFWVARLLLHDAEVIRRFAGEVVVIAHHMKRGELEFGQTRREVEPRPEPVGFGVG